MKYRTERLCFQKVSDLEKGLTESLRANLTMKTQECVDLVLMPALDRVKLTLRI